MEQETKPLHETTPDGRGAASDGAPPSHDRVGETVGRYVLLEQIGSGGGGRVFAAFDTMLDRKVALKELWDSTNSTEDIVREGRLLARLSHRAVVTIHDIAFSAEGTVFLAMELVSAQPFLKWAAQQRKSAAGRRLVKLALVDAASGIAAAHDRDIVHGDVKPANLLVDAAGRVRVTDFGVARLVDRTRRDETGDVADSTNNPGAAGTPAYMAPEQHAGQLADPGCDQYSLCLTAWEALTGDYPFEIGTGQREQAATLSGGQDATGPLTHPWERLEAGKRAFKGGSSAARLEPRWRRALQRGLDPEAAKRFDSMADLIAALGRPRRRRWPLAVAGTALVALASAGWLAVLDLQQRCTGAQAALGSAWDADIRTKIEVALTEGVESGAPVWRAVSANLDDFSNEWVRVYTETCEATTVRQEQSRALMDLRMACLRRARGDLVEVTRVLEQPSPTVVRKAHRVVAQLPDLARCSDIDALHDGPPAADDPAAVEAVRDQLARSKALRAAGALPDAQAVTKAAASAAQPLGYDPLQVDVLVESGVVLELLGEYDEAKQTFEHATKLATKFGLWSRALKAQRGLLHVVASRQHQAREAAAYLPVVEGLVERLGNRAIDRANLASARSLIAASSGDFEAALAFEREALPLWEQAKGQRSIASAWTQRRIGGHLRNLGRYEAAEIELRASIELQREWLGATHPEVAEARCDRAQVLFRLGKLAEAQSELEQALPPQEAILGASHPVLLGYRATLAETLFAQDRLEDAERQFRSALKNMADGPGPEGELRNGLGNLLAKQGRLQEAEAEFRKVVQIFIESFAPDHPNVAIAKHNLANVLAEAGNYAESDRYNQEALASLEQTLGKKHPQLGGLRLNIARGYKNRENMQAARREVLLAIEILEATFDAKHEQVVEARELLGRLDDSHDQN